MMDQIKLSFQQNKRNWIIGFVVLIVIIFMAFISVSNKQMNPADYATPLPEGCRVGDNFSQTTGQPCSDKVLETCKEGDLYDMKTGEPCKNRENKEANPAL